jgi:hypothetical protein
MERTGMIEMAKENVVMNEYWIDLLCSTEYLDPNENHVKSLQNDIEELVKLLTSIVKTSQGNNQ